MKLEIVPGAAVLALVNMITEPVRDWELGRPGMADPYIGWYDHPEACVFAMTIVDIVGDRSLAHASIDGHTMVPGDLVVDGDPKALIVNDIQYEMETLPTFAWVEFVPDEKSGESWARTQMRLELVAQRLWRHMMPDWEDEDALSLYYQERT